MEAQRIQEPDPGGTSVAGADTPASRQFPLNEVLITLAYLILAALWIIYSDRWLEARKGASANPLPYQTLKGLNFVVVTSGILFLVLRRAHERRRRAEAILRAATVRFELVARASNDAIWDWNVTTDAIWWSDGFTTLFGYGKEEIGPTIHSWTDRLHPEDKDRVVEKLHRAVQSGARNWSDDYRFRRCDGSYADVHDQGFVVHDAQGKPTRMLGGITDVSERSRAEARLRQSERQFRALSVRLETLREEERLRISRGIHDELGQLLSILKLNLQQAEKELEQSQALPALNSLLDRIVSATELSDQTLKAVQRIAADLRPEVLDALGLLSALKHEAGLFEQRTGIACDLKLPEANPELASEVSVAAFRIFQEALTNVLRHAHATRVDVALHATDRQIELSLRDNGRGISEADLRNPDSLGLLGMSERAAAVGGEVSVEPAQGGGTLVTVRMPLGPPAAKREK